MKGITELRYAELSNLMTVVEMRRVEETGVCRVDGCHRLLALTEFMRQGKVGKRSCREGLRGEMTVRVNVLQEPFVDQLVDEYFNVFLLDLSTVLNLEKSITRPAITGYMIDSII